MGTSAPCGVVLRKTQAQDGSTPQRCRRAGGPSVRWRTPRHQNCPIWPRRDPAGPPLDEGSGVGEAPQGGEIDDDDLVILDADEVIALERVEG